MSDPIAGDMLLTLHLGSLRAVENPELLGRAEYRLRVWLNGLERWQSPEPVQLREGRQADVGGTVTMEVAYDTDVINLLVQVAEEDLFSPDDLSEGSLELYRSAGFFHGQTLDVPIVGPDTRLVLGVRVEVAARE